MSKQVTHEELQGFEQKKDRVRQYTNGEVTVYWQADKCIHSANCLTGLPRVFRASKRPWIDMKGAGSDKIIKTVNTCPSRALLYKNNSEEPDEVKTEAPAGSSPARIQILRNGPALITGNYILTDADKNILKARTNVAAICRCGASKRNLSVMGAIPILISSINPRLTCPTIFLSIFLAF